MPSRELGVLLQDRAALNWTRPLDQPGHYAIDLARRQYTSS
jgi:hypothetical protein